MADDGRRDPVTRAGALARIGKQLGIKPETLRSTRYPEPGSTHLHSHCCRARPAGPGPVPRDGRDGTAVGPRAQRRGRQRRALSVP